jgi:hypothetical protein
MTMQMFLGGLMILMMAAGIVIAMTSMRDRDDDPVDADKISRKHKGRSPPATRL